MSTIKIQGAGISGLTAAINLAKEGYSVEVYEKLSDVGKKHKLNFEGLENWTSDAMSLLREINLDTDFKKRAINEVNWFSPDFNAVRMRAKKPFFYLVERGGKESIEYSLKEQALLQGVKFKFKSAGRAHIVSFGARKPKAMGLSTIYENVDYKDCVIGILSDKMSPKGYFYIIVWDNRATVCTTSTDIDKFGTLNVLHKKNLKCKICSDLLQDSKIKSSFSGFANFNIPKTAISRGKIYTSEAAGFQDYLLGFGMKYAFLSGYYAAKSIIEKTSYDRLWKQSFENEMKKTALIRYFINKNGDRAYEEIIKNLKNEKNYRARLRRTYCEYNWKHKILYNFLKIKSSLEK